MAKAGQDRYEGLPTGDPRRGRHGVDSIREAKFDVSDSFLNALYESVRTQPSQ